MFSRKFMITTALANLLIATQAQSNAQQHDCTLNCLKGKCVASTITVNGQSFQLDQCECDEGWGGVLCDEVGTLCPDDTVCYNGAECAPRHTKFETYGLSQYYCDCDTAYDHSAFAGQMCEAPATEVCEYGVSVSKTAFCTNGGQCKEVVVKDSTSGEKVKHPGCTCPDSFTGAHCEYLVGTEPQTNTSSQKEATTTATDQHINGEPAPVVSSEAPRTGSASYRAIKVISVLFMISIIVGSILLVRQSMRKKKAMKNPQPIINLAAEAGVVDGFSARNPNQIIISNTENKQEDLEEIDII